MSILCAHRGRLSLAVPLMLFLAATGRAQDPRPVRPDSSSKNLPDGFVTPLPDSLFSVADKADSVEPRQHGQAMLDTLITYEANHIEIDVDRNVTYLIGQAVVHYRTMTLEAGRIKVDMTAKTLLAEPLPDSADGVAADDTLRSRDPGMPVFSDREQHIVGERMEYNFDTQKGRVLRGRTQFEDGYYSGGAIKRVSPTVLNVSNAVFTTCDREESPHSHFWSRRMKIIVNDKVIARPIVMYIGHVPVAVLPFGVFPTKQGRHSGLIVPRYGVSALEGRYLRGGGYYWAPNDYMDAEFKVDFFERSGWFFRTNVNYALRYAFRGNVSGSFTRKNFQIGNRKERRWDFAIHHAHEVSPTLRMAVDGSFSSDRSFFRDFSNNLDQRLRQQLVSNATITKSWPDSRNNLTLNLSQTSTLSTGGVSRSLPRISFVHSRRRLLSPAETSAGSRRTPGTSNQSALKWYNNIYYQYGANFSNEQTRLDSTTGIETNTQLTQNVALALSGQKLFGWLSLTHSLRHREDWFDRHFEYRLDPATNQVAVDTVRGFSARRDISYSLDASTTVYGTFRPHIGNVQGIRHVVRPRIGFSYTPDYAKAPFRYFTSLRDTTGREIVRSRFPGGSRGNIANLNFALSNLFQMKLGDGEKTRKIDLFNLDFSTGYNFAADSLRLSDLQSSLRANPTRNLSVSVRSVHTFYKTDDLGRRLDRYLFQERDLLHPARLIRFQADLRWQLAGAPRQSPGASGSANQLTTQQGPFSLSPEQEAPIPLATGDRFESEEAFRNFDMTWRASFALSYSVDRSSPSNTRRYSYLDVSGGELQLTKNWRIGYRGRFDLVERNLVDHTFTFHRDLHEWEAVFQWTPVGRGRGFFFRINLKSPQLREIKYERQGGRSSVFY